MSKDFFIIDRFEGGIALCEAETGTGRKDISRELLPVEAKEGDVIRREGERFIIDREQTALKRQANAKKLNELLNRQKKNKGYL